MRFSFTHWQPTIEGVGIRPMLGSDTMTTPEYRPFNAANTKLAYAQAFTRSTLVRRDAAATGRDGRRRFAVLHRRGADRVGASS
jgi:hypothetical protein